MGHESVRVGQVDPSTRVGMFIVQPVLCENLEELKRPCECIGFGILAVFAVLDVTVYSPGGTPKTKNNFGHYDAISNFADISFMVSLKPYR